MIEWIIAVLLVLTGLAHSIAGERGLITPLLKNKDWQLAEMPRWAADPLLRFAWHLVAIAWFAVAAMVVGAPIEITIAVMALSSALLIFVMLPGHVGWPCMLPIGLLALWAGGALPEWLLWIGVALGVTVAVVAAGFHVAWAAGSRVGVTNAIPQDPETGEPKFRPRSGMALVIAVALLSYAAFVVLEATDTGPGIARWFLAAAVVILIARVFGEGKYVGVLKTVRETGFAKADSLYWTPSAAVLALGAGAALVLGQM